MKDRITLTPSLEDYLEAILQLEKKNRVARVKDIASALGVQMPSVSGALKSLKSKGMIDYEKNSFINLTDEGKKIAVRVYEKHKLLVSFFQNVLLLDKDEATEVGCKVEHVINIETAIKLSKIEKFLKDKTQDIETWNKIISK
ncbi:MAG: metal-dependent transcriptional regulator [Spirochaetales bacterium]|nr:metal-dependent transcriptional regulator [Spirochaetales bacterium]